MRYTFEVFDIVSCVFSVEPCHLEKALRVIGVDTLLERGGHNADRGIGQWQLGLVFCRTTCRAFQYLQQ